MIRILIADDHAVVREGLKQIISLEADLSVAGETANGMQTLERTQEGGFDLLLLDMSMPGVNGLNLITRIRVHQTTLPILVLSMHAEPQFARRALEAGANGYISKGGDPQILLKGIRRVAAGGRYIEPVLAESIALSMFQPGGGNHDQLSERELQIMCMLAKGKTVNHVADLLNISNKTVSTHKVRLMQKMNFSNNADMVRYAVEQGLAD